MFPDILNQPQRELLSLLRKFSKEYYMVGGTAIALYLGHRRSVDFDLFTGKPIKRLRIKRLIEESGFKTERLLFEDKDQMHLVVHSVKMTFFQYPYSISVTTDFEGIKMPELIDLAAMKALALGGRAKWKDYADLYFLMKNGFRLEDIAANAKRIFIGSFNAKLFRAQLSFFEDIDYAESIEFMPGKEASEEEENWG